METQESQRMIQMPEDADIRPIYDEEPMVEVQLTAECNIFAIRQQHTKQPEIITEDQLQKQLDKDEFQEDGSMTAFWVVQFQKFIDSKFTVDYDSQKTDTYFVEYTGLEIPFFDDVFFHLGNVKKSVAERTRHQRQYERRVNKRQMQTQESKIDTGKALDADLVDTKSIRTDSIVQDDNSMSGNDTDADDADIRPIYDEQPMAECVFNANHDACITKLLKEVNSRAKIQSHKTRNRHRFSPNKTSVVYEKTSPIYDLRWKPTGRIFKSVGLRWIPTGKLFDSCTSKVDSEPPHGSNVDIPNIHECKQTLDVSAGTSINVQKEQSLDLSAEVHQAAETVTTSNELDLLFGPLFDEYFNGENQVVLKSSAVTTTDASNKRQQQPDSTSSTSTLATTVTANGNFDL
ncbi:hypothetical protein Tco_1352321 [Tanacetum coccineum]